MIDVMAQPAVADRVRLQKIHRPLEQRLQCFLEVQEVAEIGGDFGLEFNEQIDVAVPGIEVVAQRGTEHLQLAYAVADAQFGDAPTMGFDEVPHAASVSPSRPGGPTPDAFAKCGCGWSGQGQLPAEIDASLHQAAVAAGQAQRAGLHAQLADQQAQTGWPGAFHSIEMRIIANMLR